MILSFNFTTFWEKVAPKTQPLRKVEPKTQPLRKVEPKTREKVVKYFLFKKLIT